MSRAERAADAALVVLPLLLYAGTVGRGFVSEDFVILRRLAGYGIPDLAREFTGPWLGCLELYRPVSTALLWASTKVLGASSFGLDLLHLLVHLASALLVRRLVAGRLGPRAGFAAAVYFVLFPLHPNTVSFPASFATLYAGFFTLLAWSAAEGDRPRAAGLALGAALLSYEGAVGGAAAVALGLLARGRRAGALGVAGLVGAYFLARGLALGVPVGGYAAFRARFSGARLGATLGDLVGNLSGLVSPDPGLPAWGPVLVLAVVGALVHARRERGEGPEAAPWLPALLAGATGLVLSLAPFAFVPIVPALGRYAYAASGWAGLLVATLLFGDGGRLRSGSVRLLALGSFLGLVGLEVRALGGNLARYREAARVGDRLAAALATAVADQTAGTEVFVAGVPDFVRGPGGEPIAQVLHWGLADRFLLPHRADPVRFIALPPLADRELVPLATAGALVLRWDTASGRLATPDPPPAGPPGITLAAPLPDPPRDRPLLLGWVPRPGFTHRVVILDQALALVLDGEVTPGAVWLETSFLAQVATLYDGRLHYWVEARDPAGGLAFSPLGSIRVR